VGGWPGRVSRLAVVLIESPDAKPNPAITPKHWEDSLFSKGTYRDRNATGQKVHGSMNDHYQEQSYEKFRIEGKAFPHVKVSKKRAEYGKQGTSRQARLTEAVGLLLARAGQEAMADFDGVFFMSAGGPPAAASTGPTGRPAATRARPGRTSSAPRAATGSPTSACWRTSSATCSACP